MIFDSVGPEPSHRNFSTQLSRPLRHKPHFQASIEPWQDESKPQQRIYSKKQERKQPTEPINKCRKKSVDERIEQMYRKYSKQGINVGQYVSNIPLSSRQMYREKLNWLQKGQEFKQIGSSKVVQDDPQPPQPQPIKKNQKKVSQFYCLQNRSSRQSKWSPKKPLQYKGSQNFQRMLKIKEKLRKKHIMSVHKQKQEYKSQLQAKIPQNNRQNGSQNTAKATLERNKLKIKMRGLSKQKLIQVGEQNSKMEIRGKCSNSFEYGAQLDGLNLTNYTSWRTEQNSRPSLSSFLSTESRQMSR